MTSGTRRLAGDDRCNISFARGVVALCGTDIDAAATGALAPVPADWQQQRYRRDGDHYHITFLTKADLQMAAEQRKLDNPDWPEDWNDLESVAQAAAALVTSHVAGMDCIPIGEGRASHGGEEAAFLVVAWPGGTAARRTLGLEPHDFHISLGFKQHDVHGRSKSIDSLSGPPREDAAAELARLARRLVDANVVHEVQQLATAALLCAEANGDLLVEVAVLEVLCLLTGLEGKADQVLEHSERLLLLDADNELGCRSRAFGLVLLRRYGEAIPALLRARELLLNIEDPIERAKVEDKLRRSLEWCRKKVAPARAEQGLGGQPVFVESSEDKDFEHAFLVAKNLKFPTTHHLKNLGAATKDDKILSADRRRQFCGSGRMVVVEEKIDGANLGISLDSLYRPRLQGRSHWVNWETDLQFSGLEQWLNDHMTCLCSLLDRNRHVLFGEWCMCLHTIPYRRLPGYFIAFDIYDREAGKFLSRQAFHTRLRDAEGPKIPAVPHVAHCTFASVAEVEALLTRQSAFGDGPLEGVYLRLDEEHAAAGSQETYLEDRCKLVRNEFRQEIVTGGTWRGRGRNQIDHASSDSEYALQSYVLAASVGLAGRASSNIPHANANQATSLEAAEAPVATPQGRYPSTPHLSFSPGINVSSGDTLMADCTHLLLDEVVVTEKLDGGNCCIKDGLVYARTHGQPASHPSFSAIKELVACFPDTVSDLQIFGENMAAVHSISYGNLTSFFYLFAVRRGSTWLSWDEVVRIAAELSVPTVPVVFRGRFQSPKQLQARIEEWALENSEVGAAVTPEGFVVRRTSSFGDSAFAENIAKYVRANHLQTDATWKRTWKRHSLGVLLPERTSRKVGDDLSDSSSSTLRKGPLANPRARHTITTSKCGDVELPRNFSFLLEDVAVSSTPKRKEQFFAMHELGICLVVTVMEDPLDPAWFAGTGVESMHRAVDNFEPPSVTQVDEILEKIAGVIATGGKIMVHCGGGKGRAGTTAACILLRYGLDSISQALEQERTEGFSARLCHMQSDDVIRYLREQRPGSIETSQQETFVRRYASILWQRAAETTEEQPVLERSLSTLNRTSTLDRAEREEEALLEAELFESASSSAGAEQERRNRAFAPPVRAPGGQKAQKQMKELERTRKNIARRAPKYIVMCGLAGAGKSTFSQKLESAGGWVRVNQDDLKRKGCVDLLARTVPMVQQGRTKVIVDRCNITRRDRGEMLDLLHKPAAQEVVCVFFDFPADDCKVRAAARENHPTIRRGGGARIIDDQAKHLERPDPSEGFGSVKVVKSFADADDLLRRWGVLLATDVQGVADAEDVSAQETEAIDESADTTLLVEESPKLPERFLLWLRSSLQEEQPPMDLENIFECVTVVMENWKNDPEVIDNAREVLRDLGAPATADALEMEWHVSHPT